METVDFKPLPEKRRREILEVIRARIAGADADGLRRAMLSMGWLEGAAELTEPLMTLVEKGAPELVLAALDGLAQLKVPDCEQPLARKIVGLFKSAQTGLLPLRRACIRTLGQVGTANSVAFLSEIIKNPAPADTEDREAAVEALVSLAVNGVNVAAAALVELYKITDGPVKECLACALKELDLQQWEQKGYLTIEAEFEPDSDRENDSGSGRGGL